MTTALSVGTRVSGFIVTDVRELDELKAVGVYARHEKTGAEVFHLLNDDEENLFSFAFATPPADSTGIAHILEHSVLCGSERHPLKDAFLVLAQGSLQTFLNAMTFPDKTVYPASSTNEADYFNLMAVYGDAVFRPLLAEWTFNQEGRRYEFVPNGADGAETTAEALSLTGVVYNEMKGAYSSMDAIAGRWLYRSVLNGTPYEHDSGGDPEKIPDLEWADLKQFHAERYVPANCKVFLCGNIATERQLAFLDERFFSTLEAGVPHPPIPRAVRWTSPRTVGTVYPAGEGGDGKSTVYLNWLCGDATDSDLTIALAALAEILLGHDGSPLARALVESRLGEDLSPICGMDAEIRESVFAVGLRGVAAGDAQKVADLILSVLRRVVEEGVEPKDVEAALRTLEFSNREIKRAGGPFSLAWMRRSLRGWLHGTHPTETLLFAPRMAALKTALAQDSRYFEGLIRRYLLDNPHRALVTVDPDTGLNERREAELRARLAEKKAALTDVEANRIRVASAELARVQEAADPIEALATIPHISRADLSREVETVPRRLTMAGSVPIAAHELFTNGIVYIDFAFPADVLESEDYRYLPLLSRALLASGLPGMDWGETASLLARTVGGLYAVLQTSSLAPGAATAVATPSGILDLAGRDWIVYRLKALEDQLPAALPLVRRLIVEATLGAADRLRDLLLELRNDFDSSLAPGGHSYAAGRAGRLYSRSRAVDELWGGVAQLEAAHAFVAEGPDAVAPRLIAVRDRLAASSGLMVNLTGSAAAISAALPLIETEFAAFGAPRPRNPASADPARFFALTDDGGGRGAEVLSSASLQVGFGALALPAAPFASREQAAELVLAHRLSTGPLWEEIRMKGGAYGAFAYPDGLEPVFTLATYRDPSPARSLDAFAAALEQLASERIGADDLEKAIIGTYAKETRPRAPADKGFSDFMRLLYGIEENARRAKLSAIIDLGADDLAAAARRLLDGRASARAAIVSGSTVARAAAEALGASVRTLPM